MKTTDGLDAPDLIRLVQQAMDIRNPGFQLTMQFYGRSTDANLRALRGGMQTLGVHMSVAQAGAGLYRITLVLPRPTKHPEEVSPKGDRGESWD